MSPQDAPAAQSAAPATRGPARILISDALDPAAVEVFRARGLEPEVRTGLAEDELVEALAGARALVVRSSTKVTRRVLEAADDIAVVGRAGIGVDNVDCEAATERGVVVMNTPTGNATTTAEHAIALLVSLARHVPRAAAQVKAGSWKKKGLLGTELTGKTLGVVGLGRIGRLVAKRALGLEMKVVAHDPYLSGADSPVPGAELRELHDLLAEADFVTLHVPLTDATRGLISWEQVARMKPGARLVNASRGGVVDEEAVLDALVEGRLAGAAFDVLADEPPQADHPLLARDDVIVTPHLGASSAEAQLRVAIDIADQISDFLLEGVARNAVNAPPVSTDAMRELAPYLLLAEKMGAFLAQRLDAPIRKVELTVSGEVAALDAGHLRLALLVGLLKPVLSEGVNFVNAPILAEERGLRLLESTREEETYPKGRLKIRASTRGGEDSHVVSGTVFGREPRLVRVDDVHLDLSPRGTILLTQHRDVPGVVGAIGTALGAAGVNIRRVELAPAGAADGDLASGFFALHEDAGLEAAALLESIRALDPVEVAQLLRLG